jgi:hypothetical protein
MRETLPQALDALGALVLQFTELDEVLPSDAPDMAGPAIKLSVPHMRRAWLTLTR